MRKGEKRSLGFRPHPTVNIFGSKGSSVCGNCPINAKCCSHIQPPALSSSDIAFIKSKYPGLGDDFYEKHDVIARPLKRVIPKEDGTCAFLTAHRRCAIYDGRPIDCRLFPLDLIIEDQIFWWTVYNEFCPLGEESAKALERAIAFAERDLTPRFNKDELSAYARYPSNLVGAGNYRKLRPLALLLKNS